MATMVFGAIGASLGGSVLGGALGATLGRMVGALAGRFVDEHLFGGSNDKSVTAHTENLRITTLREGAPITEVFGRNRIAGHMIWFGGFKSKTIDDEEHVIASFALGLCEGVVHRIGRVWVGADEVKLRPGDYRLHQGHEDQNCDSFICKCEGVNSTPAYKGFAYLVFEEIDLYQFANRIPNLEFEVFRHAKEAVNESKDFVEGVAIIPGSGDYVYATEPVTFDQGFGKKKSANMARQNGETDFCNSFSDLRSDLPRVRSSSLVVSWFGNDLRASKCFLTPRVEQREADGDVPWYVSGVERHFALKPTYVDGRPVYGGTPSDLSVIQAIHHMRKQKFQVMFYPFILMDIPETNGFPSPYGGDRQPVNPWRGRITTDIAEGSLGSEWGQSDVDATIDKFMGYAQRTDFSISNGKVEYNGPPDWGYRRFILHYMFLCRLAGGVDEFLIGSELIGLTSMKSTGMAFPFVSALKELAKEAKSILGSNCKIGYAADWSEYFGYAPKSEPNALYFHLDPLWSDENIDFIGIDNYMPMSDWREAETHRDDIYHSIYDRSYLAANVARGEGYDWYYKNQVDRDAQVRTPITDSESEPWVWRYKDIENWWSRVHYDRPNGVRSSSPTSWTPRSKPIYFTEYGTAALNNSSNQPNKFVDPKSSESSLAYFSDGSPDSFIQSCYIEAFNRYWNSGANNPPSNVYEGRMVDPKKSYYWCWDARPWPEFPGRSDLWSDAENYRSGHWLNGRANLVRLSNIVREICAPLGIENIDVSKLYGHAIGVSFKGNETIRQKLEFLMRTYLIEVYFRDNKLYFVSSGYDTSKPLDERLIVAGKDGELFSKQFDYAHNPPSAVEIDYIDADGSYEASSVSLGFGSGDISNVERFQLSCVLDEQSARSLGESYFEVFEQSKVALSFTVGMHDEALRVGDVVHREGDENRNYLIEKVFDSDVQNIEARAIGNVRAPKGSGVIKFTDVQPDVFKPWLEFVDLPFGDHPYYQVYANASPWVGKIILRHWSDADPKDQLFGFINQPSLMGSTLEPLAVKASDRRQNQRLKIKITGDDFDPVKIVELGMYVMLIGEGTNREYLGFESYYKNLDDTITVETLYRGLAGSKVSVHASNSPIIVLENNGLRAGVDLWKYSEQLNFFFAPLADEENFGDWLELERPSASAEPLPPCHIQRQNGEISFIPRHKQDLDHWVDVFNDDLHHNFKIFSQDSLIASGTTNLNRIDLPEPITNGPIGIEIQSVDPAGRTSPWHKETI